MTKVTHLTTDEHGGLNRRRIHLREISGDADQPLGTVGQELRAARLRRGDDLAAVSRVLKIRKDHLEAIEEDRIEALPGRAYAVGFVRSYADYLGLEPVQAVERFKAEIAGRGETPREIALSPETDERQLPHGWIVIAILLLALVAYGAYHLARSADTLLLKEPVAPVPARIALPPPIATMAAKQAAPVRSTATPPSGSMPLGGAPTVAQPPAGAPAAAQTSPPAPVSGMTANTGQQAPGPASASLAAQPGAQPASVLAGKEFGSQNKDARVILKAKLMTRVLVQGADGTVFINRILQPGDSFRVPDKVGLSLTTPDGGAIAVELDGQEMGRAGPVGQVTDALSLDPQAIVDRYNGGGRGG